MSVLGIPLAQAEEELAERIRLGQELLDGVKNRSYPPGREATPQAAWDAARRWHDYNCTWLGNNLGSDVREEYQAVTGRTYVANSPPASPTVTTSRIISLMSISGEGVRRTRSGERVNRPEIGVISSWAARARASRGS